MTSPLPPRRRDSRNLADLIRQNRQNLKQLAPGFVSGRFPPARLRGHEDGGADEDDFADEPTIAWEWGDRATVTATGTHVVRLSHAPLDESLFVRWHPGGDGGLPLTNEFFTVTDQTVTIPDPGYFAAGDAFSFQYEYEIGDDVLGLEFIAAVDGVFHPTVNTMTFTPPPEMLPGDFLVAAIRGAVAAGGGDTTLGVTSGDSRLSLLYSATLSVVEGVLTGFATGSTADIVTNIVPDPSYLPSARGVMLVCRGVAAVAGFAAVESGATTPQVAHSAAIAVTWAGNASFSVLTASPPTGYTDGGNTGLDYGATDISYWFDPDGTISPAGAFAGEGCLVIGLA